MRYFRQIGLIAIISLVTVSCTGKLRTSIVVPDESVGQPADATLAPSEIWQNKLISPIHQIHAVDSSRVLLVSKRSEIFLWDMDLEDITGNVWQPFRDASSAYLIKDNVLYIGTFIGKLIIAYDLAQRKRLWRTKVKITPGALTIACDRLYFPVKNGRKYLDINNGEIIGQRRIPGKLASALIAGGKVLYGVDREGRLLSLDENLKIIRHWDTDLGGRILHTQDESTLVLTDDYGNVTAFDLAGDSIRYSLNLSSPVYARPVIDDNHLLIPLGSGEFQVRSIDCGELLWKYRSDGLINQSPAVAEDVYILPMARGRLTGLSPVDGSILWEHDFEHVITNVHLDTRGLLVIDRKRFLHLLEFAR